MSNSTKIPRIWWKSSQTYKEKSDLSIALLMFFCSESFALQGEWVAVVSYRLLHSLGETPFSFLKALQKEEKLLKPTA